MATRPRTDACGLSALRWSRPERGRGPGSSGGPRCAGGTQAPRPALPQPERMVRTLMSRPICQYAWSMATFTERAGLPNAHHHPPARARADDLSLCRVGCMMLLGNLLGWDAVKKKSSPYQPGHAAWGRKPGLCGSSGGSGNHRREPRPSGKLWF
jgi:hypothetical protein